MIYKIFFTLVLLYGIFHAGRYYENQQAESRADLLQVEMFRRDSMYAKHCDLLVERCDFFMATSQDFMNLAFAYRDSFRNVAAAPVAADKHQDCFWHPQAIDDAIAMPLLLDLRDSLKTDPLW